MRLSSIIGFLGVILSTPLLAETLLIEGTATEMEIPEIRIISMFIVYLPIFFGLVGSLFAKWLHTLSGVFLFTSGLVILIPGIIFGIITENIFFGIISSLMFIFAGALLLFKKDKKL